MVSPEIGLLTCCLALEGGLGFFGATTFFGGFTDGFTTGVHPLGGGSSGKSLSSIFFVLVDGSCTL